VSLKRRCHFRKSNAADFIATMDKDGDGKVTFFELLKELFPMTPSKQLNDIYRKFYPEAAPKTIKYILPPEIHKISLAVPNVTFHPESAC
jgi:hypothetical protein